jgi:hypothetical protein
MPGPAAAKAPSLPLSGMHAFVHAQIVAVHPYAEDHYDTVVQSFILSCPDAFVRWSVL